MIFEFKSESGEVIEKNFRVGKCPKFVTIKKIRYNRVFSLPTVVMDANKPKTIGSLAEQNTRKREKDGIKNANEDKKSPWWRQPGSKPDRSLANLKGKKLERFLFEGKK